jgi:D-cysteine desulfhydrase
MDCPVVGLSISGDAAQCRSRTRDLIDRTMAFLGVEPCVADDEIEVLDGYRGEGYGKAPEDLYAFIHDIAQRTGLILDPVYTGKAFWGTVQEMRAGCLQHAQDVVFVHTGGVFGIYQQKDGFKLDWQTV